MLSFTFDVGLSGEGDSEPDRKEEWVEVCIAFSSRVLITIARR
jgi:hypothetical protein